MPRCKAPEIPRSEAYMKVRRSDEGRGQRRRGAFFSTLLDPEQSCPSKLHGQSEKQLPDEENDADDQRFDDQPLHVPSSQGN